MTRNITAAEIRAIRAALRTTYNGLLALEQGLAPAPVAAPARQTAAPPRRGPAHRSRTAPTRSTPSQAACACGDPWCRGECRATSRKAVRA